MSDASPTPKTVARKIAIIDAIVQQGHLAKLQGLDAKVLMAFATFADSVTGEAFPSVETITKLVGSTHNIKRVRQSFQRLHDAGIVVVVNDSKGRKTTVRRLQLPTTTGVKNTLVQDGATGVQMTPVGDDSNQGTFVDEPGYFCGATGVQMTPQPGSKIPPESGINPSMNPAATRDVAAAVDFLVGLGAKRTVAQKLVTSIPGLTLADVEEIYDSLEGDFTFKLVIAELKDRGQEVVANRLRREEFERQATEAYHQKQTQIAKTVEIDFRVLAQGEEDEEDAIEVTLDTADEIMHDLTVMKRQCEEPLIEFAHSRLASAGIEASKDDVRKLDERSIAILAVAHHYAHPEIMETAREDHQKRMDAEKLQAERDAKVAAERKRKRKEEQAAADAKRDAIEKFKAETKAKRAERDARMLAWWEKLTPEDRRTQEERVYAKWPTLRDHRVYTNHEEALRDAAYQIESGEAAERDAMIERMKACETDLVIPAAVA